VVKTGAYDIFYLSWFVLNSWSSAACNLKNRSVFTKTVEMAARQHPATVCLDKKKRKKQENVFFLTLTITTLLLVVWHLQMIKNEAVLLVFDQPKWINMSFHHTLICTSYPWLSELNSVLANRVTVSSAPSYYTPSRPLHSSPDYCLAPTFICTKTI